MKNFEIKTIKHKGIRVPVMINYDTGMATLVEKQGEGHEMPYRAKQWLFKGRSLEYMDSWINILEAMTVAVKECKVLLEEDLAEKQRIRDEELVDMVGMIEAATDSSHTGDVRVKINKVVLNPIKKKGSKKK